jgi:hypothetical protein
MRENAIFRCSILSPNIDQIRLQYMPFIRTKFFLDMHNKSLINENRG